MLFLTVPVLEDPLSLAQQAMMMNTKNIIAKIVPIIPKYIQLYNIYMIPFIPVKMNVNREKLKKYKK